MYALICLIVALVLFILAAIGAPETSRINLTAAGLAFLTVALIVGHMVG